jgi:hypothetical protein
MLPGLHSRDPDGREGIVRGCDDDHVHVGAADRVLPVIHGVGSRAGKSQLQRGPAEYPRTGRAPCERSGALAADQAASDDRHAGNLIQRSPHVKPRSFGTIRRSV